MDAWQIGLIVVIVAGFGLIIFGAFWDRSRNRKRAAEMLAPPQREIPQFRPDAPAPHYLSDLQARRAPEDGAAPSSPPTSGRPSRSGSPSADIVTIKTGYASKDFVTDTGQRLGGAGSSSGAGLRRPGRDRPRAAARAGTA